MALQLVAVQPDERIGPDAYLVATSRPLQPGDQVEARLPMLLQQANSRLPGGLRVVRYELTGGRLQLDLAGPEAMAQQTAAQPTDPARLAAVPWVLAADVIAALAAAALAAGLGAQFWAQLEKVLAALPPVLQESQGVLYRMTELVLAVAVVIVVWALVQHLRRPGAA